MKKAKYIGMMIGTAIGLVLGWATTLRIDDMSGSADYRRMLAVPLGMIGYAVGALLERE